MAFVTRVLLFAFFQIGAVDGTVLDSKAAFTSASAVEDERMLRRDTLDEESYTKSKANAAASIAAWKQKVAMQGKLKSGERELTEAERRKIMQIKHADLEKKYGTPAAVAEKPKPLRFSPLWHGPAESAYMPDQNPDISPVYLGKEKPTLHNPFKRQAIQVKEKDSMNSGQLRAEHDAKAKTTGIYDLNLQQMNIRITENQKPRKEMAKSQKKQGLLRKKAPPVVRDNKWKNKMRDTQTERRSKMEHRMMRRLAFNVKKHH